MLLHYKDAQEMAWEHLWAGPSPGLNPIVNIWSNIKLKHFSTTKEQVKAINIEWKNTDSSFCKAILC